MGGENSTLHNLMLNLAFCRVKLKWELTTLSEEDAYPVPKENTVGLTYPTKSKNYPTDCNH